MSEFYEPNLFLSTPEHPNTMGVMLKLTEPVDGDLLQEVVEQLRERSPISMSGLCQWEMT